MSLTSFSEPDREVVRRLLTAAGATAAAPTGADADAADYDWKVPRRYAPDQVAKLGAFAGQAAGKLSDALFKLLRDQTVLAAADVSLHYGSEAGEAVAGSAEYAVEVSAEGLDARGVVLLRPQRAAGWMEKLLGGSADQADAEQELSSLEKAILADMVAALVAGLSEASRAAGGKALRVAGEPRRGDYRLPCKDADEFVRMPFADEPDQPAVTFLIPAEALDAVAGRTAADPPPPEQVQGRLQKHVESVPVTVTAEMGRTRVPMRDIMTLEPGDVLLLHKTIGDPIALRVDGRTVLTGFVVRCEGRYAVQVAPVDA